MFDRVVLEILSDDINRISKLMKEQNATGVGLQALNRSYVRTVFAAADGYCWQFKQYALEQPDVGEIFTTRELAKLQEKKYIADTDSISDQNQFLSAKKNMKFSLMAFARAAGVDYVVDTSSEGWNYFVRANDEIRNRITHPKARGDMLVQNEELEIVVHAKLWFEGQVKLISEHAQAI